MIERFTVVLVIVLLAGTLPFWLWCVLQGLDFIGGKHEQGKHEQKNPDRTISIRKY